MDLTGRVAVITGASSGLGNAFCKAMAENGAKIAAFARRADRLEALKEELDGHLFADRAVPWQDQERIRPTRTAAALMGGAAYEALKQGLHEIHTTHLLLSLVRHERSFAADLLRAQQLDYGRLLDLMRERRLAPSHEETALPRMEDLLGPLGEQLSRLYAESRDKTHLYS